MDEIMSLYGLNPQELTEKLNLGRKFIGKQIYQWLTKGVQSYDEMTNIPKQLRERLKNEIPLFSSKVIEEQTDETGAVKLAVKLSDGAIIECVMLTDIEDRRTACLSSQVGCAMGCRFCRTGTMGLKRNLKDYEIIEQFMHLSRLGNITHIVYMGMGEPLNNLGAVAKSIRYFHDPDGINISIRRITISTCGVVPGINKLGEQNLPVKLAVSLVTADNTLRNDIMPVNRLYDLTELRKALTHYQHRTKKRFTFEYCMLHDVNTSREDAKKLAGFVRNMDVLVNLIPWNPAAELPWETPTNDEIDSFTRELDRLGVQYSRRFTRGRGINGACGQLAHKQEMEDED